MPFSTYPWKGSTAGRIGNTSSKAYPRDHPSIKGMYRICLWDLRISFPARFLIQNTINRCLSSHLKLRWINFKELSSWLSGRFLYWKCPDSSQDTLTAYNNGSYAMRGSEGCDCPCFLLLLCRAIETQF